MTTQQMIFWSFIAYTLILFFVTWLTARRANSQSFFRGNKRSPWPVVAYGMIGASLSGVTFMSVPGWVGDRSFSYLLMVAGYVIGYVVVAFVLLPLYYRLNLTTIYTYLHQRFGFWSYKTGSFFFLLSRTLGASLRMFIVISVLQTFVFDGWNIPFELTTFLFLLLILIYTFKGGIKTIIWTDTLQTTFMLLSLVVCIIMMCKTLGFSFDGLISQIGESGYSKIVFTDPKNQLCWWKQILGGMFITISMTGLDQEMMQKNLSCKNLRNAQKNMLSFSFILIFVNMLFLILGASLYIYANKMGITTKGDLLFPVVALNYLGPVAGLIFVIGLISALFPSADGALTSLTTAFSIDFLNLEKRTDYTEKKKVRTRHLVHASFAMLFVLVIIYYRYHSSVHLISTLYYIASLTYGPLLGMFAFGLLTKRSIPDRIMPAIAVLSPVIAFLLDLFVSRQFNYKFDFELLVINGLITASLMFIASFYPTKNEVQ
jgi:Na+/proline symporter